jgi:hypothetical protein
MKKEEFDILLERYYAGETTPDEERRLKNLFLSGDVPEGYESETDIFRFIDEESLVPPCSQDLSERIISALPDQTGGLRITVRRRIYQFSGAAAAILVIIASWLFLTRSTEPADTFDDPKVAYAEAMKVLYEVSSKLNEGVGSLQPVSKMNSASVRTIGVFDETARKAARDLKSLEYINQTIEMTNIPDNQNQPR